MKKTLSILSALLLLGACTKDLDVEFDVMEPRVVVMSCVEPDSVLSLRLTYSRFFLSSQPFRSIDDATATLTINGTSTEDATSSANGSYLFGYHPQPGDRLDLQVQVPGMDAVTATTTVPRHAGIGNVRASFSNHDKYDYTYSVRFTLDDPADEDNFYCIRVIERHRYTYEGESAVDDEYCHFSCTDYMITESVEVGSIIDGDNMGEFFGRTLYFSDNNINGHSHEVALNVDFHQNNAEALLEITSYSRDRYLYELTTSRYDDDLFEGLFAEPVQVHCNIDGGIGIFGARNRILVPIPLQQ